MGKRGSKKGEESTTVIRDSINEYNKEVERINGQITNHLYITILSGLVLIWGIIYGKSSLGLAITIGVIVASGVIMVVGILDLKGKMGRGKGGTQKRYQKETNLWKYNSKSAVEMNSYTILSELEDRYKEHLKIESLEEYSEIKNLVNWEVRMVNKDREVVLKEISVELLLKIQAYKLLIEKTPKKYSKELRELLTKMYSVLIYELESTDNDIWEDEIKKERLVEEVIIRLEEYDDEWYRIGKLIKAHQKELVISKLKDYIEFKEGGTKGGQNV